MDCILLVEMAIFLSWFARNVYFCWIWLLISIGHKCFISVGYRYLFLLDINGLISVGNEWTSVLLRQRGEKGPLASLTNKQHYVWSRWWWLLCQFQQGHLVCSFNALWHDYFQHFNISFSAHCHWAGQYFNIFSQHTCLGNISIFQYFIFVSQHTGLGKYQRRPVRTGEARSGGYLLQKFSRLPVF